MEEKLSILILQITENASNKDKTEIQQNYLKVNL